MFPQSFHTRKLGVIAIFWAVFLYQWELIVLLILHSLLNTAEGGNLVFDLIQSTRFLNQCTF